MLADAAPGPSVLLLSRYERLGASSRLRFLAYLPALRAAGLRVTEAPLLDDEYLRALYTGRRIDRSRIAKAYARRLAALRSARRHDLVWLEKEALPWLPARVEAAAGLGAVPYVMDIDDAWFERYARHRLASVRALLGTKFATLARNARIVLAGNPYLADWAAGAGARDVRIQPTVVELGHYAALPVSERKPGDPATVGWIGSPSTAHYLAPIGGALARLGPAVRLRVVGAAGLDLPVPATFVPWREESEAEELARFDIGVMPLPDEPWERGKCGYKLIQYMAAARPVVASPVGVNTTLVQDGVNGFLAEGPEAWAQALGRLAADPDLRARMGAAGRRMVEERYNLAVATPPLVQALREAVRPAAP
ncbi:glycosyltransferase involved in cell wall biosynthesis [Azospirillum brasilense]|uniref:Glycosyltransferase involved in cell wall biosynthesis n=1 Tax=Azospirillum brasilense TaxID=192 RepID=A0A560BWY2_AZOBR|nr:glycosyltransferase family 4 protein [Azospirillum brasilense]TWA77118.1 glycosyltransferase involved in cell wall biosynthesis [Azospirillum brasilense]